MSVFSVFVAKSRGFIKGWHKANWLAVGLIFPSWFDHLEESVLAKKLDSKEFALGTVKNQLTSSETPENPCKFLVTCSLILHTCRKFVTSWVNSTMYQQEAILSIASRENQAYSAVYHVPQVTALNESLVEHFSVSILSCPYNQ